MILLQRREKKQLEKTRRPREREIQNRTHLLFETEKNEQATLLVWNQERTTSKYTYAYKEFSRKKENHNTEAPAVD